MVRVRKSSKDGGENSGYPLRRSRSHEVRQHASTAKSAIYMRAGKQERVCPSATETQWQSCLICSLTIHCLTYSLSLSRSSTTHMSSSPSSPSFLSSKVHGRLLFDFYFEQCQSNIYITLQYIPPNDVTKASSTSCVVSGSYSWDYQQQACIHLYGVGSEAMPHLHPGGSGPPTGRRLPDDTVVGDDGSAYLFWLPEQISFACLDIWAGSKLR